MFGGTFSGPPSERPLRSANARGSAPPFLRGMSQVIAPFAEPVRRRTHSSLSPSALSDRSLSFLPPTCRRARAGQGRSLPRPRQNGGLVQLRAFRWPEASL
jgi:hypothetical protein